jgi:hypothetical protein
MRKLLQKIYDTIVPISWKNYKEFMEAMTIALDGTILAADQQSEMLANLVTQINNLQKEKVQVKKEVEYDEAFQ